MHFYIYILEIVLCIHLVTSQVRRSIEQLQDELYEKTRGTFNFEGRSPWFKPIRMTSHSKFMLCVDIYQKVENIRLMNGKYEFDFPGIDERDRILDIPDFEQKLIKIRNVSKTNTLSPLRNAIHCPLDKIFFEKIGYRRGYEFFIQDSPHQFCLYMIEKDSSLQSEDLIGYIIAEVCSPLLDIKYNNKYAEQFLYEIFTRNSSGLKRIEWPELHDMDNQKRFVLCLDIYEKISMTALYGQPFVTSSPNRELPRFKNFITQVSIKSFDKSSIIGPAHLLHCPMNDINYEKLSFKGFNWKEISPYFLLQSINDDCYYKLLPTTEINPDVIDEIPALELHLQGEVCGIFGPINTNAKQLETDFILKWAVHDAKCGQPISWKEIFRMFSGDTRCLCENVFKKVYKLPIDHKKMRARPKLIKLRIDRPLEDYEIFSLGCSLGYNSFHLFHSPRLGCVYYLTKDTALDIFKIEQEVCGVYPVRYTLKIGHSKMIDPML